jgi:taurine--2-oxoglutarate transaminase
VADTSLEAQAPAALDWSRLERWDRAYYLHNVQAQADYVFTAVERTEGNNLVLADGTRLLDFQSQLISDSMGHRHPRVHAEIKRAMERYGHVFFGLATDYRARAAKLVLEDVLGAPDSWAGRIRILSTGTEGVENALSMARLYTGRPLVLTQASSYHGLVAPGATQLRGYRGQLTPAGRPEAIQDVPGFPSPGYQVIPQPEFFDDARDPLPSLEATEQLILAVGPENVAAVITETMFGAAGLLPPDRYHVGLRDLARKYGFLWVADEVLTGFGRLGEWFGYQTVPGELEPDLLVVGKGINGCALPVGGVVASREIAEHFDRARWWSGSTHDAHPLVCASIVGNLEAMLEDDVVPDVRRRGAELGERLRELQTRHPSVGRVGGRGFYWAVDLVDREGLPIVREDRLSGFLGDLTGHPNNVVAAECFKRGVFLGGFVPNTIKVAPPFTVSDDEIEQGLAAFDAALDAVDELIRT